MLCNIAPNIPCNHVTYSVTCYAVFCFISILLDLRLETFGLEFLSMYSALGFATFGVSFHSHFALD